MRRTFRQMSPRNGLTLLEIVLALAILAMSLVVISQLIRLGTRGAGDARLTTEAQLLCQSKMASFAAGLEELAVVAPTPLLEAPDWLYAVNLQRLDEQGLMVVEVSVIENRTDGGRPVSFSLVRWLPDPGLELDEEVEISPTAESVGSEEQDSSSSGEGDEDDLPAGLGGGS